MPNIRMVGSISDGGSNRGQDKEDEDSCVNSFRKSIEDIQIELLEEVMDELAHRQSEAALKVRDEYHDFVWLRHRRNLATGKA
jgi:hypothetical protein